MNNEAIPDFAIEKKGITSGLCCARGIVSFKELASKIRSLPYRRTSDPEQIALVLEEGCGTCSSKHAFLAQVAMECDYPIQLMMGIYEMNEENTPGVGSVISDAKLSCIPEAHCYLMSDSVRLDLTRPENPIIPKLKFLKEEALQPNEAASVKTEKHKLFLKDWIIAKKISITFDELWTIRERCIASLC